MYLLAQGYDGSLFLTDADAEHAEARQVDLITKQPFQAFMQDGDLRIVEILGDSKPYHLKWHTIDPATGTTRHSHEAYQLLGREHHDVCVVHCEAGRAVGLLNAHTAVFMNAETMRPIAESSIVPSDSNTANGGSEFSISSIAWSENGSMLALALTSSSTMLRNHSDGSSAQEEKPSIDAPQTSHDVTDIQIYDTSSGARLQSLRLEAVNVRMTWSASLDLLAVSCKMPSSSSTAGLEGERSRKVIKLLSPARPSCRELSMEPRVSEIYGFDACEWTPDGQLLLVSSTSRNHRARFLDPAQLNVVFTLQQEQVDNISWALSPQLPVGSVSPTKRILAYLQDDPCKIIELKLKNGQWHGQEIMPNTNDEHQDGIISPDGRALILRQTDLDIIEDGSDSIYHYDCKTRREHYLDLASRTHHSPFVTSHAADRPACPPAAQRVLTRAGHPVFRDTSSDSEGSNYSCRRPKPSLAISQPTWADIPRGWSQVYACHTFDKDGPTGPRESGLHSYAVVLIDAGVHRILANMNVRSLMDLACAGRIGPIDPLMERREEVKELEWSPNCKHLAVICTSWILIMSFARTP